MLRVIAVLAFLAGFAQGADQWTRLTTPNLELYTTAGEKKGRDAVLYFEQVRSFFAQALPVKGAAAVPIRVIVFNSQAQFKPYAPNDYAFAFYTPGRYRDYIVMRDAEPENSPAAIHEYIHLIVHHSHVTVPLWMNEGLASLYSKLRITGKRAMVGYVNPGYAQVLRSEKWMRLDELASVDLKSPAYNEADRVGIFYAESWALVHMLYLSPEYRPKFTSFLSSISKGTDFAAACQLAFGKSSAQVYSDLESYLQRNRLMGAVFDIALTRSEEEADTSPVRPQDSEIILADLLSAMGKRKQAADAYRKLAAENPGDPDLARSMGYLAWQDNDSQGAREQFEKSFATGGRDPEMCFHLAILELRTDPSSDKAVAALQRALEVKPDYRDARLQLGLLRMNARDYVAALAALSPIHEMDGEHAAMFFNALAYAYSQTGNPDEARKQAEIALKWDRTDADKRQTEDILRYLNSASEPGKWRAGSSAFSLDGDRPTLVRQAEPETTPTPAPVPSPVPRPAPAPPLSPIERKTRTLDRLEGTAKSVDCAGKRLLVDVGGKILAFDISQASNISIQHKGAGVFDFICGPQKPFHVIVGFVPPKNARTDVSGILRSLEF